MRLNQFVEEIRINCIPINEECYLGLFPCNVKELIWPAYDCSRLTAVHFTHIYYWAFGSINRLRAGIGMCYISGQRAPQESKPRPASMVQQIWAYNTCIPMSPQETNNS